jgi:N-acetylneuraminic acid mutarotase
MTFQTNETPRQDPVVLTKEVYNIKTTSVILQGQVTSVGNAKINEFGFVWSPTPQVDVNTSNKIILGEMVNPNSFEYLLTDLNQSTNYYFRAFVTTDETIFYGSEISFKTSDYPWRKIANFPGTPRVAAVAFSIGSRGYVGLGYGEGGVTFKDLWEYNPDKNEWTRKSDFKGESRSAAVAFSIGENAYVGAGAGTDVYNDFWQYSPATDQWTPIATFPGGPMYYAVGFSINDRGYVGTGVRNGTLLKEFWEYEPVTNAWTRKADYGGQATDVAAAFALGGKGYIGTGNLPLGRSREFWEYDPAANTWTRKSDMESDRWLGVGFSLENRGYIGLGNGSPNDFWEYNPTTNQWTNVTPFPGGPREASSAFVIGKKAYVGLGAAGYPFPNDFWEYDPNR